MSWDIFVENIPNKYQKVDDIPNDFKPKSIYTRKDLIKIISSIFDNTDFSDPSWGIFEGDGYSIEFSLGPEEPKSGFTMHVRGNNFNVVEKIDKLLVELELRAIETGTGDFFSVQNAKKAFKRYQNYRDHIINSK